MLNESDDDFLVPKAPPAPVRKRPNVRNENSAKADDDFFPFKAEDQPQASSSSFSLRCDVCGKMLDQLNEARRILHVNGCLDKAEAERKLQKEQEKHAKTVDCPMCGTPLQPGPFQISHVKKCGKSHQIGGSDLLKLVDTQRKIADEKKKIGMAHTKAKVPVFAVPKPKKITGMPRNYQEEQTQLAQALSASMIESAPVVTNGKQEKKPAGRSKQVNSLDDENRRKRRRSSFGIVELEPRKCHCDIVNVIQNRFMENFRIRKPGKAWKPLKDVVQKRAKKTARTLTALARDFRKLNRLERLADDLLLYAGSNAGDVSLLTSENGTVVKCHRFILAARTNMSKEISSENTVDLQQYSADVIRCYVKFLYGAVVEWSSAETEAIRNLAEQYGPVGLSTLLMELEQQGRADEPSSGAFQSEGIPIDTVEGAVPESDASELFPFAQPEQSLNSAESYKFLEGTDRPEESLNPDTSMNPFRNVDIGSKTEKEAEAVFNHPRSPALVNDTLQSNQSGDMFGFAEKDDDIIVLSDSEEPNCSASQGLLNANLDSAMLEDSPSSPHFAADAVPPHSPFDVLAPISPMKLNIEPTGLVTPKKSASFNDVSPLGRSEDIQPTAYSPCFPENSFHYGPLISPVRFSNTQQEQPCSPPRAISPLNLNLKLTDTPASSRKSFGRRLSRPLFEPNDPVPQPVEEDSFYNTRDDLALFGSPPPKPIDLPARFVVGTPLPCELEANPFVREQIGPHAKILKTKNITPKPNFSAMSEQELKEQLGRFGVRPMGKKKGIALLERIYEETHPVISTSPSTSTATKPSTNSLDLANAPRPQRLASIAEANSSQEVLNPSGGAQMLEESIMGSQLLDDEDEEEEPAKSSSNSKKSKEKLPKDTESLQKLFASWVRQAENSDIYQKILTLRPIPIEEISDRVSESTTIIRRISKANLMDVLDRLHVTFILPKDGWKKKHERAANRAAKKRAKEP